jgi:hypothetical protein
MLLEMIGKPLFEGVRQGEKVGRLNEVGRLSERVTEKAERPELQQRLENLQPASDTMVQNGLDLNQRLAEMVSPEGMRDLAREYPNMQEKLEKLEVDYQEAEGPRDYQQIEREIQQYRGIVMENMVEKGLGGNFTEVVEKQQAVQTAEGVTKPDVQLRGAKESFDLGDLHIERGQNLSIEVKSGSADYIQSEFEHILKQVEGHESNSLVITTREYLEIPAEAREAFEERLRERGSHILVSDVPATAVDNALRAVIIGA